MSEVMDLINSAGSGYPNFQFDNVGDKLDGTLTSEPRVMEKRNDRTGAMDKILVLELRASDGTDWTLMSGLGGRITAIREALSTAGATSLTIGGRLVMQYTGDGEKQPGKSAPKFYKAAYEAPKGSATSVDDLLN